MSSNFALTKMAASQKRIAHLLLLYGSGREERREAALELAAILNCKQTIYQCDNCSACKKIKSGNHPDIDIITNAKQSIGIEQIKVLQEKISRKHYEGDYKVYIIEEADRLTLPAANALLKIAEEPPQNTILILCTANSEGIIPTLHSRSQLVFLPSPTTAEWRENSESDEEVYNQAYYLSGGDLDLAKCIREKGIALVNQWLSIYYNAIEDGDFLKLFPLFPLEREESLIFLQILAVSITQKTTKGEVSPAMLTVVQQTIQAVKRQANHRLAIEVLALKHMRTGGAKLG